jgi:hypothetical protein
MPEAQQRSSRGTWATEWVEKYCLTASGARRLTGEQCREISRLYDEVSSPGMPPLDHLDPELAACLRLLHLCGPMFVRGSTIAASPPPGTFWLACSIAKRSPVLWRELRLENGKLVCPELGTALTE